VVEKIYSRIGNYQGHSLFSLVIFVVVFIRRVKDSPLITTANNGTEIGQRPSLKPPIQPSVPLEYPDSNLSSKEYPGDDIFHIDKIPTPEQAAEDIANKAAAPSQYGQESGVDEENCSDSNSPHVSYMTSLQKGSFKPIQIVSVISFGLFSVNIFTYKKDTNQLFDLP